MEESLAAIREAVIPQIPSSSTASPHGLVLGMTSSGQWKERNHKNQTMKKSNRHQLSATSVLHVFPHRITPPPQPRPGTPPSLKRRAGGSLLQQFASKRAKSGATPPSQGESPRAQGPPLTSESTKAPYGEGVPPLASQESPAPLQLWQPLLTSLTFGHS
ncbi:hypothetical protein TorRG33x02_340050 [Trema orientale]|uniref:Uncharacterized protein n=1 Tax=Trema orientale TaxID=63057 RepID=A0A2P5AVJ7_TREOI|nr:hypothetical protein TorRG33x02_340050 [Trema orientale]